ncbi:MAG: hypothetical protein ABI867_15945 [Kofleriaceae bacterium]
MKRLVILAALTACSAAQQDNDTLSESIRSYNDGVRWGRYGVAAARVLPKDRNQFVDDMDARAEDVKITDYEVVNIAARGPKEAKVRIKMSWYLDSKGSVYETHAEQTWERKGKHWFMVEEARVRGHEMPGLSEPVER